jgi:L-malate glycosyltransferase
MSELPNRDEMSLRGIKVLLVYHGAALKPSRMIFDAIANYPEIQLRVLAPKKAFNPMRQKFLEITEPNVGDYELVTGKIFNSKKSLGGPYLSGLLREMKQFRPEVIHIFNEAKSDIVFQALLYRNWFHRRAKVLFFGFENIIQPPTSVMGRWKWKYICKYIDGGAYANSEGMNKLFELGLPKSNVHLTYWGIPLTQFRPQRNEEFRKKLGVNDKFLVGYVGRITQDKGIWTILHAMKYVPQNVECLIVGDGPWSKIFQEKRSAYNLEDRIHWIKRVDDFDVPLYLNAMDAFVLASEETEHWKEQFGRVLAEAMACGLPVIATDSGAIPEVVGDAGMIFHEKDPAALASAILDLYEHPQTRQNFADKGIKRSNELFSCDAFASRLINIYKLTASGG